MSLDFPRIEAGRYSILQNKKMVGYIEKKTSSKWIVYVCENVATKGAPRAVEKTLKDCKAAAVNLITSVEIDESSQELDNLINSVQTDQEERFQRMMEMEERHQLQIREYWMNHKSGKVKEVEPFSEFLTEDQVSAL